MRKIHIIAIAAFVLILAIWSNFRVDSSFATSADLRFEYTNKDIHVKITDPEDIKALREILHGYKCYDPGLPSCGFGDDVSITMTDGRRSIMFCPACDGCTGFRIGNTNWYIDCSAAARKRFEAIVKKYGMTFPCV